MIVSVRSTAVVVIVVIAVEVVVTVVVYVGKPPSTCTTEYEAFLCGSLAAIVCASKPLLLVNVSLVSLDMGMD